VTTADLTALVSDFTDAMAAAADGGKSQTIVKNAARAALIYALRQDALYVQTNGNNDPLTLLSSGYNLSSTNHAQSPLAAPVIESITNAAPMTLAVRATPITNARAYEAQRSADGGLTWAYATTSTRARQITVPGLNPGTTYQIRLRAVGGSTGFSNWSDPVSHMAT
jgi:hypothetical protein